MVIEEALIIVDTLISPSHLNSLQETIFRQCWDGKSYEEIAAMSGYTADYIRVTGSQLWQVLSEATGEKITKHKLRSTLRQWKEEWQIGQQLEQSPQESSSSAFTNSELPIVELPDGPVPLNSRFYLERFGVEERCYREITKPGALIRIKASSHWGKTSLALRILNHARSLDLQTAHLNFQQIDRSLLSSLDKFMRWFCAHLSQQLQLDFRLDEYWDVDLGSKASCTNYLQYYLLPRMNTSLVLVMDEINRIFESPIVAQDFLPLLRFWHEESKHEEIWEKLRMIVSYSTEILIPLNCNQSPFNVGLPIVLQAFSAEQIEELAQRHELKWHSPESQTKSLMALQKLTQGHPYLIRLALYHLAQRHVGFGQLIREAPTETGIYGSHLRELLTVLESQPDLAQLFKQVVMADGPIRLEPLATYKLASLGLIRQIGNEVLPICELYRFYFRDRLHHDAIR
ncbi:MAG: hypothetical protein Kow00121_31840 [Elainellaceae cyanobacterium]